ncbi:PhoH family protein [bacterium]|nr:PhoH family protein [bacterium]
MPAKNQNKSVRKAERKAKQKIKQTQTLEKQDRGSPVDIELRNDSQKQAWKLIEQTPITFLLGAAGSGKTFLAMAYAINEILQKRRTNIILTRPIVEAGERLGYLPGTFGDKVNPYMQPLYDTLDILVGKFSPRREVVNKAIVLAPLCYMRGRSFNDAICIFDEAQNATYGQLKLFLSRFGQNTQAIITGDPLQSDLPISPAPIVEVMHKLANVPGIATWQFSSADVVRHPIVAAVLNKL